MVAPVPALAVASAGLSALGKILGGVGAKKAGKARAQALEYSAGLDLQEAGLAAQLGLEEDERVAANLAVNAAAGGGGGLRGSALAVLDDLGRQSLMKARNTSYAGMTAAWARRNDASAARAQGSNALTEGIVGAGGSLLGGFARAYAGGAK
ncbi:hypothetical protein [Phenylobacterium sp. SCN 70-31]|uniref:hypothetical protein n=1 Tax=Phenylobacterium sp. SCN 70-31 TaxID=1660129 RepID=UPI00086B2C3B|nr:hypothetical protein [Phenylobacterium sp. SCN 70-31]ODT88106.1 MAG: hypothetical protein ABS78_09445 [Phenylobacterium sp. SCN 70-31]